MFTFNGENFQISVNGIKRDLYEGNKKKPFYYDEFLNEVYLNYSQVNEFNLFFSTLTI